MNIYSIKDTKSTFMKLFEEINDDMAMRTLAAIVNNPDTQIAMFPEDFELWHIGTFDNINGNLESDIYFVSRAVDKIRKEK